MVPGQFHGDKVKDGEDWRYLRCEQRAQRGVTNKGNEDEIYGAGNELASTTAMWENAITWGDRREELEMFGARLRDEGMLLTLKGDEEERRELAKEREREEAYEEAKEDEGQRQECADVHEMWRTWVHWAPVVMAMEEGEREKKKEK